MLSREATIGWRDTYSLTRSIQVEIVGPNLRIDLPYSEDDHSYLESGHIPLVADSTTWKAPDGTLDDDEITWKVEGDPDGEEFGKGHVDSVPAQTLGVGTHTLVAEGSTGVETAQASVTVDVQEGPEGVVPPEPGIISPDDGSGARCRMDGGGTGRTRIG